MLSCVSTCWTWAYLPHTDTQYSATEYTRAIADVRSTGAGAPPDCHHNISSNVQQESYRDWSIAISIVSRGYRTVIPRLADVAIELFHGRKKTPMPQVCNQHDVAALPFLASQQVSVNEVSLDGTAFSIARASYCGGFNTRRATIKSYTKWMTVWGFATSCHYLVECILC